ncbi:DUF924 family protein [Hahella sp. KA22]|uniref:DUF924 family protein n=1 Tax=Hahella sp. KA22 TaxID=1628392 RepID=UPI000FDD7834|nr:DUF924 family protein [Hahella sp. KA22]AZZ94741.1 DUF924 family protein [Hahella sp. KA22]QAY58115.1 DUF924 family protein [Hahella sp. KA22]
MANLNAPTTYSAQTIAEVITFWSDAGPQRWFAKDPAFDDIFRDRFLKLHMRAAKRELDHWAQSPDGALALLILLDQFPRNAFRGSAHMYATDALALLFAKTALTQGFDKQIDPALRLFFYLPFAHSEHEEDQHLSGRLNAQLGADYTAHARSHRNIIQRFGRFPHRNAMLGRVTTQTEQFFLDAGGFAG